MIEILDSPFRKIEIKRERLQESVGHLGEEQLRRKPGPQSWSILEVLEHIVLAEQLTTHPADRKHPPRTDHRSFELVSYLLNNDVIVGVPDTRMEPGGAATDHELFDRWASARRQLAQVLEEVTEDTLERPISHHPIAGPLTPVDLLRLIDMHVDHHQRQIERICEEMGMEEGGSPFTVPRSPLNVQI